MSSNPRQPYTVTPSYLCRADATVRTTQERNPFGIPILAGVTASSMMTQPGRHLGVSADAQLLLAASHAMALTQLSSNDPNLLLTTKDAAAIVGTSDYGAPDDPHLRRLWHANLGVLARWRDGQLYTSDVPRDFFPIVVSPDDSGVPDRARAEAQIAIDEGEMAQAGITLGAVAIVAVGVAAAVIGGVAAYRYLDPQRATAQAQVTAATSLAVQRMKLQEATGRTIRPSPLEQTFADASGDYVRAGQTEAGSGWYVAAGALLGLGATLGGLHLAQRVVR